MKLMDWVAPQPVHVTFGRRGSTLSAIRGASSVTIYSDSGATVELPAATDGLAGVMAAADKAALGAMAGAGGVPVFASRPEAEAASLAPSRQALQLSGYAAAGDRGGALYKRAATEPAHPGKLRTADGAWWEIAERRLFAEMFGAVGDGTTDSTAKVEDALAALEALGGGYLHFGPGTFVATITPCAAGRTRIKGIRGERGGTVLRAATDGAFCISKPENVGGFTVEHLTVDGTGSGGIGRRRCGIYLEIQGDLRNVRFQNCLVGYARQNAYYGLIEGCRFQSNDIGLYMGTRAAGGSVDGLADAAGGAQSLVLPAPGNANGHAGNCHFLNCHLQQNRIGLAVLPTSQAVTGVRLTNTTIEGNADAGILAARFGATFESCWMEANNHGSSETISLDGNAVRKGNLVLLDPFYAAPAGASDFGDEGGSRLVFTGGSRVAGLKTADRGEVHLDSATLADAAPVDVSAGGSVTGGRVQGDALIALPAIIRAPLPALGRNRGLLAEVPHRTGRIYEAQPPGGSIRCVSDFTGTGYGTARLSNWHSAGAVYGWQEPGGLWPEGTCLRISKAGGGTVGFALNDAENPAVPAGAYQALVLTLMPERDATLVVNGSGAPFNLVATVEGGRWQSLGICILNETGGTVSPIVGVDSGDTAPFACRFGFVTLARFGSLGAAANWFEEGAAYLAEG